MRKAYILLILGIWVALLPQLGFPYSLKDVLVTLSGLGLIYLSILFYREFKIKEISETKAKTFDNFSENKFENTTEESQEESQEESNAKILN